MLERCDRCNSTPPREINFWVVKSGRVLCNTCHIEWIVFREFWVDAVNVWRGDMFLLAQRQVRFYERQLRRLRNQEGLLTG